MKPQYTKGKLEEFPFQDGAISLVCGQDQIADMVNEYEGDLQHNNAILLTAGWNIIQSLADSLGVNAVELAQRMEEKNVYEVIGILVNSVIEKRDSELEGAWE